MLTDAQLEARKAEVKKQRDMVAERAALVAEFKVMIRELIREELSRVRFVTDDEDAPQANGHAE